MIRHFRQIFILICLLGLSPTLAEAKGEDLISKCSHLLDRIMGAMGLKFDLPAGTRNFRREWNEISVKYDLRRVKLRNADYMDRVYSEWVMLGDPEYHLTILKYPVPQSALEVLTSAIENRISPEALNKLSIENAARPTQSGILHWCSIMLRNPRFEVVEELEAWIKKYEKTRVIIRDGIKYYTGLPSIPDAPVGTVRVYKGTNFYKGPAL